MKSQLQAATPPVEAPPPAAEPEFEINIGEYVGMVRRHWRLLAAICAATLTASLIQYAITPKAYMASATLQIERRGLSQVVNSTNPWLDAYNVEFYPTQYKLIESRGLAERVVKLLDLANDPHLGGGAAPAQPRHRPPAAGTAAAAAGTSAVPNAPPGATNATRALDANNATNAPAAGQAGAAGGRGVQVAVPGVVREGGARASAAEDEATLGRYADELRGGLSVEPIRNTELVVLSYQDPSPDFAARAVNGFAEAFIDMGVEDRYASAGKTSTFLGSQIDTLKSEITDREAQLQAFSRKKDIVTLEPGSNVILQRLEALNANYIEAKKSRIEKEAEYHELQVKPTEAVADTTSGGIISDLRAEQIRLEREYDSKLKTFKPDWPPMVDLMTQIQNGRKHMAAVVKETADKALASALATYQTALRQEQGIENELNKLKSENMDQNSESVQYNNLRGEVQTRRDLLNELLRKQSESEVTARLQNARDSNVRIIDRALVPGMAIYPSLRKSVSTGLLVGLLLGVGTILLIEFLDRTVKTPEEVERRLGLPTLAVVPDITDSGRAYGYYSAVAPQAELPAAATAQTPAATPAAGRGRARVKAGAAAPTAWLDKRRGGGDGPQIELVPHTQPRSPISEAYRSLRTGLLLSSAEQLKVIAITSAEAGEGKTATASNLAVVLAQLGRQVLLVDADLRRPRMHQVFRVSNRYGLVNQLTVATDPEVPGAIAQRTEVANLWLTPSGPLPPNPSELLASDRMREWLREMRGRFDVVVIDTPPALAVTDAILVGALADGVVLTLRSGKVSREDAKACRDRLRHAGVRVLGVVLNRYRSLSGSSRHRYRYYEGYGVAEARAAAPNSGSAA